MREREFYCIDSVIRCVTIHGTHNITVEGCTAFNSKGHCYFVEDGNEMDNTFLNNLGINAMPSNNEGMLPSDTVLSMLHSFLISLRKLLSFGLLIQTTI